MGVGIVAATPIYAALLLINCDGLQHSKTCMETMYGNMQKHCAFKFILHRMLLKFFLIPCVAHRQVFHKGNISLARSCKKAHVELLL